MSAAASPTNRAAPFYRPELDTLRFFAFFYVFLCHGLAGRPEEYTRLGVPSELALWISGILQSGANAVGLFFVLSSYLITELLLRERARTGRIDVRAFYMRRTLRIWPLYYVFVILVFVALRPFGIAMEWQHFAAFSCSQETGCGEFGAPRGNRSPDPCGACRSRSSSTSRDRSWWPGPPISGWWRGA